VVIGIIGEVIVKTCSAYEGAVSVEAADGRVVAAVLELNAALVFLK
jgi:hypothetical protein